jgi:hypothetical protein
MYDDRPALTTNKGFEPPPGKCQGCGGKSDWRMIKVAQQGGAWRARYAHNVLDNWDGASKPDWSKISMKPGMKFAGWLELCNRCNDQPITPNCTTITPEEIEAHKGANLETIKRMLAEATDSMTALPYDKTKRGGEV